MFEVVQLGWQPGRRRRPTPTATACPTRGKRSSVSNPDSAAGGDGSERRSGWRRPHQRAGADGTARIRAGFHTRLFRRRRVERRSSRRGLPLLNPGAAAARVLFRFLRTDGTTGATRRRRCRRASRVTLDPAAVPGIAGRPYSTVVESDSMVVVDRTMTWDATGYGSHAETALAAPSTTWYLAEGATHGAFDLFYLLQNPNATAGAGARCAICARSRRRRSRRPTRSAANSRHDLGGPGSVRQASRCSPRRTSRAAITSTVPIVVERAMYMTTGGAAVRRGARQRRRDRARRRAGSSPRARPATSSICSS